MGAELESLSASLPLAAALPDPRASDESAAGPSVCATVEFAIANAIAGERVGNDTKADTPGISVGVAKGTRTGERGGDVVADAVEAFVPLVIERGGVRE